MEAYLKDTEETWYDMPNNVVGVLVDPISGLPAAMGYRASPDGKESEWSA